MSPAVCYLSWGLRGVSLKLMLKPIKYMNVASNDASHLGELSPGIVRDHCCSGPPVARIEKATWRSAGKYLILCWKTNSKVSWKGRWLPGAHQPCHLLALPAPLPPSCKARPQLPEASVLGLSVAPAPLLIITISLMSSIGTAHEAWRTLLSVESHKACSWHVSWW